jgi:hypothetical protein
MKKNSRFDCLKNTSNNSRSSKRKQRKSEPVQEPKPAQAQEPKPAQAQEPMPAQAQAPKPVQAQEPTPAQAKAQASIMSWKDKIKASKETHDPYKPIRGCVIMYKDKKTNKIHRIEHPTDIAEQKIREQQLEEERQYQFYINYRQRLINDFIYDLEIGNRDDFNNVEEYIEYLDKLDEEPEEEEIQEDDDYDSQDEYNSYEEN